MVSGDHDDLDSGRSAFGDGIGNRSSGRVDQGHQADEAKARIVKHNVCFILTNTVTFLLR